MFEELKVLLDMLGNVDDIALWIVGGFAVYKLIIYLSSMGAVVMIIKLIVNKLYDVSHEGITNKKEIESNRLKIREQELDYEIAKTSLKSLNRIFDAKTITHDGTQEAFVSLLNRMRSDGSDYVHTSDVVKLEKAWAEYNKK